MTLGKISILQKVIIFIALFLILGYKLLPSIKPIAKLKIGEFSIFLLANVITVAVFYFLSRFLLQNQTYAQQHNILFFTIWHILGILIVGFLWLSLFQYQYTFSIVTKFRSRLIIPAILAAVWGPTSARLLREVYSLQIWPFISNIVGKSVFFLLNFFFEGARYSIDSEAIPVVGIPSITVKIHAYCSGIEGIGLFIVLFTILTLIEFKNLDKQKLWVLYPLGVIGAFMLNILRIFTLLVVGHYTTPAFAVGGFHSNIGWILFTIYFLIFIFFAYPWMLKKEKRIKKVKTRPKKNMKQEPMLKYILPFLVVLFGIMLGDYVNAFLAYAIRIALSMAVIAYFWKQYKEIKIKWDWQAWIFGFLIIIIWIALEFLNKGNTASFDPFAFQGLVPYALIILKLLGLVLAAPIIEEIFMRSFLIRAIIDPKRFEYVPIGKFTWLSFILSTGFFGIMHGTSLIGSRLIVGLISGAMFNLWLYYRKDIFSCIQCHAAANLGLAIYVLATSQWLLW